MINIVSDCCYKPCLIKSTDHLAIILQISTPGPRGPSFWKFNNALLKDLEYVQYLQNKITQWGENNQNLFINNHRIKWEMLKYEIKERSILFSKIKGYGYPKDNMLLN